MGWNIFITNVPKERLEYVDIQRIYGLRWRIEIVFKAWKSELNLDKLFKKQSYSLVSRAIIQFHLILLYIVLFLTRWYSELLYVVLEKTERVLSFLKFAKMLQKDLKFFFTMYENDYGKLIQLLAYHYTYDNRKDRCNYIEVLYNKNFS